MLGVKCELHFGELHHGPLQMLSVICQLFCGEIACQLDLQLIYWRDSMGLTAQLCVISCMRAASNQGSASHSAFSEQRSTNSSIEIRASKLHLDRQTFLKKNWALHFYNFQSFSNVLVNISSFFRH